MHRPSVVIVSPALANANNGNWQTARRWRQMLAAAYRVRIVRQWPGEASRRQADVLLALHARRSADSIAAWHAARGSAGLAVVLTGTDLYQDIEHDAQARQSLQWAGQLVVLQSQGIQALAQPLRGKTRTIYQSTTARRPPAKTSRWLNAVMVGHLRQVKSPQTLFAAARLLAADASIRIDHIGEAGEPSLGEAALATAQDCPNYHWRGALPHPATRLAIQRAHVLVHTSAMEGGAHVIMEAVRSGTPVLASRVPGNVGMLGDDYAGYFEHGDAAALARLLLQCRASQQPGPADGTAAARTAGAAQRQGAGQAPAATHDSIGLLGQLAQQCALRAPLFAPETEAAALHQLVADLLAQK